MPRILLQHIDEADEMPTHVGMNNRQSGRPTPRRIPRVSRVKDPRAQEVIRRTTALMAERDAKLADQQS